MSFLYQEVLRNDARELQSVAERCRASFRSPMGRGLDDPVLPVEKFSTGKVLAFSIHPVSESGLELEHERFQSQPRCASRPAEWLILRGKPLSPRVRVHEKSAFRTIHPSISSNQKLVLRLGRISFFKPHLSVALLWHFALPGSKGDNRESIAPSSTSSAATRSKGLYRFAYMCF